MKKKTDREKRQIVKKKVRESKKDKRMVKVKNNKVRYRGRQ